MNEMKTDYSIEHNSLWLKTEGDFCAFDDQSSKDELLKILKNPQIKQVVIDGSTLGSWDSSLAAYLFSVMRTVKEQGIEITYKDVPENLQRLLSLAQEVTHRPEKQKVVSEGFLERLGMWGWNVYQSFQKGMHFSITVLHSMARLLRGCAVMRRKDFWFAMEDVSYKAVAIVALVSFMVGLILAFVGAIQLKTFGAQVYVASLVAIAMTRIMGAIMAGIIMAGRTGAAYAATIGTMQVNEEIDALRTMGIPVTDFLVLPRISSLILTMPILTMLADLLGILGGGTVGTLMLGIPVAEYWKYTNAALSMNNFLVGVFHGFIYGWVIALCGCYWGIYSGRDADSVGKAATKAVVSAIVWMIVVTGFLTWIFEAVGI